MAVNGCPCACTRNVVLMSCKKRSSVFGISCAITSAKGKEALFRGPPPYRPNGRGSLL